MTEQQSILEQYLAFDKYAKDKYGIKSVVFMQVGSFYESYGYVSNNGVSNSGVSNPITKSITGADYDEMSKILNYETFAKPGYRGVGIPAVKLDKGIKAILRANYTFVQVDQESNQTAKITRKISIVYSPGTYIGEEDTSKANVYIIYMYVFMNKKRLSIGLSSIDVSTGEGDVYEIERDDQSSALTELYRYITSHQSKEILAVVEDANTNVSNNVNSAATTSWLTDISNSITIVTMVPSTLLTISDINYQRQFLAKVFPNYNPTNIDGFTSIQYLGLERYSSGVMSLILLYQYIYEHNVALMKKIQVPIKYSSDQYLVLANNAIEQLDVISDGKTTSLFDIVNNTSTGMGYRLLKQRILNPILDIEILNKRYDMIDKFKNHINLHEIKQYLRQIIDIDHYHRKILYNVLSMQKMILLRSIYDIIKELYQLCQFSKEPIDLLTSYIDGIIDVNMMNCDVNAITAIAKSPFRPGYNINLDTCCEKITQANIILQTVEVKISETIKQWEIKKEMKQLQKKQLKKLLKKQLG